MRISRLVMSLAVTLVVAFGAQAQTQQWSQPTQTQQWSQPSKTQQWSQPSATAGSSQAQGQPSAKQTQQWSAPVYTRKRTDAENAAIVDQIDRNAKKRAAATAKRPMSQAQAEAASRGADTVNKVYREAHDRGVQADRATFEADRRHYEDRRNRLGY